jgi:hypothetical protein
MSIGRFGRGKTRLLKREQFNHDQKSVNKRIGKVSPEDGVRRH